MKNIIIAIEKISAADVAYLLLKCGNVTFETDDGALITIDRQKFTRIYTKDNETVVLEALDVCSSPYKDSMRINHQYFFIEDSKSAIDSFIKRSESEDPHKPFGQLLTLDDLFQEHKLSFGAKENPTRLCKHCKKEVIVLEGTLIDRDADPGRRHICLMNPVKGIRLHEAAEDKIYNVPFGPEFNEDMKTLHELAGHQQVGYSINFEEGANTWWISIESSAPSERMVTKSRSLCFTMEMAIQHLRKFINLK